MRRQMRVSRAEVHVPANVSEPRRSACTGMRAWAGRKAVLTEAGEAIHVCWHMRECKETNGACKFSMYGL